ncbi:uncharacterized protein LOC123926575 [Meles meles]|uniref:uncharacterized protein LOC123926575 n=1 Tax=Meles meles TaxID=9662 RepID=UPI001E69C883|nr:uncharacterized protein LOC123926575 [Meles meles]
MDRSLHQIFQHLECARSSLKKLCLPESQDVISSSTSSVLVAQKPVLPCCGCKKAKHSTKDSSSFGSLCNNSCLSHLPVFSEGTTWQLRSHSLPILPKTQSSMFRNKGTPLPPFQLSEFGKSKLLQNLAALSPLRSQNSFINSMFESPDLRQQEKTKNGGESKSHLTLDHGPDFIFTKARPRFSGWAPIRLSPLARWELEGHMAWKVYTLREQAVPLPVRESWGMLNYLIEAQGGVPEPEKPQIQVSVPIHQSTEQSLYNKFPNCPSFQLHVNIGVESGLNRTETKISQSLIPGKQSQLGDGPQILTSRPLVTSLGTPLPKNLGADIIPEKTTGLQKEPKHVLELNIEQRVIGRLEKRIQQHKSHMTNVELTPSLPCQVTDSIKVTPLALLQVMDSMGMIPESHSEVIESVGLFPQPPAKVGKPMETTKKVSVSTKPSYQVTEPVEVTPSAQHRVMESKMTSRPVNQVTDNVTVTPAALLQVTDSMGMINESHPHIIKPVGKTPRTPSQAMKSGEIATSLDHKVIPSGKMHPKAKYTVVETVEMTFGPHPKVTESVNITLNPESQITGPLKIPPGPICQNTRSLEMISSPSHQVTDYTKVTPVAQLQAMDFMGIIPPAPPHVIESGDSQSEIATLAPGATQPVGLTSSSCPPTIGPPGVVGSVGLPPKPPLKITESVGMIPMPSHQSIHSLKVTPAALGSPMGMIITPQSQVVETQDLTSRPVSQVRKPLELTPGSRIQVQDSVEMTPQPYVQGTKTTALTPGLPHQVMESPRLTPRHQILESSEMCPRQSHQIMETMGLASDPIIRNLAEPKQSHHQIMEHLGTVPRSLGQRAPSKEMSQEPLHQVTESAVMTTTSLLPGAEYLGVKPMPQVKTVDSMKLSPGLQNVKSIDVTPGSVPQIVKYGQPIPTVSPIELAPELQLQTVKSNELAPISQLESGNSVQLAPGSQLQGVKSIHLNLGTQQQSGKSAELAQTPHLQNRKSLDLTHNSQLQGLEYVHLALPPKFSDTKAVELILRPPQEDKKSMEFASKPWLPDERSKETAPVLLLKDVKFPQMAECRNVIPETQVESMKYEEPSSGAHIQAVNSVELNLKPNHQATEPEGLTPWHQALESSGMITEPGYQGAEVELTSNPCHHRKESMELTQPSLRSTPGPLNQTSECMQANSVPFQDALETMLQGVKALETRMPQHIIQESPALVPGSEMQGINPEVLNPESQSMTFVHLNLGPYSEFRNYKKLTSEPEFQGMKSVPLTPEPQPQSTKPDGKDIFGSNF